DLAVTGGAVNASLPAQSVTLFVVPAQPPDPAGLSIGDVTVTEGRRKVKATFTVTLSPPSAGTVTVGYATADGTARAGLDYAGAQLALESQRDARVREGVVVAVVGEADPPRVCLARGLEGFEQRDHGQPGLPQLRGHGAVVRFERRRSGQMDDHGPGARGPAGLG